MNSLLTNRTNLSESRRLAGEVVLKFMGASDPDGLGLKLKMVYSSRNLETLRTRIIEKVNFGSVAECDHLLDVLKANQTLVNECITIDPNWSDFLDDT